MPDYALGRKVEEKKVLSSTRSQNTHAFSVPLPPPLFQVRTLRQQKETTHRTVQLWRIPMGQQMGRGLTWWQGHLQTSWASGLLLGLCRTWSPCTCPQCSTSGSHLGMWGSPQTDPSEISLFWALPNSPSVPLSFPQVQYSPFLINYVFTLWSHKPGNFLGHTTPRDSSFCRK